MITSMISSMIRPMITSMVNPDGGTTKRIFIELDATSQAHYSITTPIVFSDDFEVTALFLTSNTGTQYFTNIVNGAYVRILNGVVRFRLGDAGGSTKTVETVVAYNDGKLNKITYGVRAGEQYLQVNNDAEFTVTARPSYIYTADRLTTNATNDGTWEGICADFIFTDKSASPDPAVIFKLDEPTANTETSNGNSTTYVNIAEDEREEYQLSDDETQWDNISPPTQLLPAVLEIG